jgi:hypothetical protein
MPQQADAHALSTTINTLTINNSQNDKGPSEDLKITCKTSYLVLFQHRNNYSFQRTFGLSDCCKYKSLFQIVFSDDKSIRLRNTFLHWKQIRLQLIFPEHYFF